MVSHVWYHKNLWYPHLWYPRYVSFMVSHLWYPVYDIPINIVKHRKTHWAPNRLIGFYATSRAKMAAKTKSPTLSWRWQMANLWYITCPGMTTAYTCINSFLFICMYIYIHTEYLYVFIYSNPQIDRDVSLATGEFYSYPVDYGCLVSSTSKQVHRDPKKKTSKHTVKRLNRTPPEKYITNTGVLHANM